MRKVPIVTRLQELIIGIDVGGRVDATVLILLEKLVKIGWDDIYTDEKQLGKHWYRATYADVFPMGMSPSTQIDRCRRTYSQIQRWYDKKDPNKKYGTSPAVVVDRSNVGLSFFEQFKEWKMNAYGLVTVPEGSKPSWDGREMSASSKDLTDAVDILLDYKRIEFPDNLQHRRTIMRQMETYTWKRTATGLLKAENLSDKDHDDAVSALQCAVWYGEQIERRRFTTFPKHLLGL